jgi:RsiW-degrading membrane proteinase PrsW (M82 family)
MHPAVAPRPAHLPDPERTRRTFGLVLYVIATLLGATLLGLLFVLQPLFEPDPVESYTSMLIGGLLAIPAGAMYLTVPRLLDRYDPEPLYALWACVLWGAVAACGFSATINSIIGAIVVQATGDPMAGQVASAVFSAPIVEELFKGIGVFGVWYFLRREFDGVVDGIIYATFIALGFATVENALVYYPEAARGPEEGSLFLALVLRGGLSPWVHPVFTAMIGIGFGLAREAESPTVRMLGPFGGYAVAVFLHFVWNASATLGQGVVWVLLLPLWLIFVLSFLVIVAVLVRRFGRVIRDNLVDEVALGTIDHGELALVCSAFGVLRARLRHGRRGEEFVRAVARLALSKWHTARAMRGRQHTVSMDFIVPLRQRIRELKSGL